MNRTMMDFWVGLFVALGFVAITFISLKVANLTSIQGAETYQVKAAFTNIGALKLRAPVKSAGVTIGRVMDIRLDPKQFQAIVTLAINGDYVFSVDASAGIMTSGLLGEQYVDVQSGAEDDVLKDGDIIGITSSAVVLESLISEFMYKKASEETPQEPTK